MEFELRGKRLLKLSSSEMTDTRPSKRVQNSSEKGSADLSAMPTDVIYNVASFLDAKSLLNMRTLNRSFRVIASHNSAGWDSLCETFWKTKIHIRPEARDCTDRMAAYRLAVEDARTRDHLLPEELIYDVETKTGTIWSFRFKQSAGEDWTESDPWFNGLPCRKMVFLANGRVKMLVQDDDGEPSIEHPRFSQLEPTLADPPLDMAWRFLSRPLDMPTRPEGSYIRFSVGGRDVPTYCVHRSPTKNWGFVMESCWGVYASFELPKKPISPTSRILRRAQDGAGNWFNVEVEVEDGELSECEHDDDDGDNEEEGQNRNRLLIDDDSFAVTSGLQWKEAFLYNFGARTLPEGDDAVAQFERTYGAVLNRMNVTADIEA
ncbi:unnamed protein product [Cylindrotheca closterium]|uniref:F-box domain-containing protein n=1 Tax=Cylindrotheca closterium TaxID=2856 RepID=A0AAD2FQH0_9STRA|nr:unnamed protein product [Cylindrotheca closterium]